MTTWPKDNQTARNAFYGDPGAGEIASQMVPVVPPFAMYYEGQRVKAIQFHKKAAPALLAALREIWDYCQHDQAKIDAAGVSKYAGAYNHRLVRGSKTKWSNHAYAAAIDLNAGENALGVAKGTMPQFVVDAFCRQGAMWGGWYKSRPDWMHFEFVDNGGRAPKSAKPVWPPAPHVFDAPTVMAPPDEFEPASPVSPEPLPGFLATDPQVTGDPEVFSVQRRLKARHYSPGLVDGLWGSGTAGAVSGFINDRGGKISAPASLEAFNTVREDIKAELQRAESEGWFRPVTSARASGDAATVAQVAPEVVPVQRNFLTASWAFVLSIITAVANWFKDALADVWDFFTDHKDDIPSDPDLLHSAWAWVTGLPPVVWILAAAGLFGFIALNSRASANVIKESVSTGARQ